MSHSQALFDQIGCDRESVGLSNRLLQCVSIVPIAAIVRKVASTLNNPHSCSVRQTRKRAGIDRAVRRRERRSGSARVRSLWQVKKQDAENQIDRQKLHALKPIRFAVAVDLKN